MALFGADVVGSYLADHKWPFANLVYLNSGTTAIVLILLPLLPACVDAKQGCCIGKLVYRIVRSLSSPQAIPPIVRDPTAATRRRNVVRLPLCKGAVHGPKTNRRL